MQTRTEKSGVRLNAQTVGNLLAYLEQFPTDSRVVIHTVDRESNYHDFDCVIGCNTEYQLDAKKVVLTLGFILEPEESEQPRPRIKPGTIVTIFEDPFTRRHEEGRAECISFVRATGDDPDGIYSEDWWVRFIGDEDLGQVYRTIAYV